MDTVKAREAKKDARIGGQAVLEGVMMRGISTWAVAVRKPSAEQLLEGGADSEGGAKGGMEGRLEGGREGRDRSALGAARVLDEAPPRASRPDCTRRGRAGRVAQDR